MLMLLLLKLQDGGIGLDNVNKGSGQVLVCFCISSHGCRAYAGRGHKNALQYAKVVRSRLHLEHIGDVLVRYSAQDLQRALGLLRITRTQVQINHPCNTISEPCTGCA